MVCLNVAVASVKLSCLRAEGFLTLLVFFNC